MSRIAVTDTQVSLLQHTLGLDVRRREPWRNLFVADAGHDDKADLEAMVEAGLMMRTRSPGFLSEGDVVYMATDLGKAVAVSRLPEPPVLSRYKEWLQADNSQTFAEWLGVEIPRLEHEFDYGYGYRTYGVLPSYDRRPDGGGLRRVRFVSSRGVGEWSATRKEAKASYKADMARRKAAEKAAEEARRAAFAQASAQAATGSSSIL